MSLLIIIFIVSVLAVAHTYVIYPLYLSSKQCKSSLVHKEEKAQPTIDILIAAYNEEKVIQEKILSILRCDYPMEQVRILVGSDGSDDKTDEIVENLSEQYQQVSLHRFPRSGKSSTVNRLVRKAHAPILVLTDANVLFSAHVLGELAHAFNHDDVGLAGADIHAKETSEIGIAHQEDQYLKRENRLKYVEGQCWGTMMGAFGGCYAIRRELFKEIPPHFLVDDFYISMSILKQGKKAILVPKAICYEDISSKLSEEFRRKVRMSTGNFQNFMEFKSMLFMKRKGLSFAFFSHKVLRWLSPLFILTSFTSLYLLSGHSLLFTILFYGQLFLMLVPFIDTSLRAIGLRSKLLRFITYFVTMNLALLIGMFKFFKGVKVATWQPTERHQ